MNWGNQSNVGQGNKSDKVKKGKDREGVDIRYIVVQEETVGMLAVGSDSIEGKGVTGDDLVKSTESGEVSGRKLVVLVLMLVRWLLLVNLRGWSLSLLFRLKSGAVKRRVSAEKRAGTEAGAKASKQNIEQLGHGANSSDNSKGESVLSDVSDMSFSHMSETKGKKLSCCRY